MILTPDCIDRSLASSVANGMSERTAAAYRSDLTLAMAAIGTNPTTEQAATWLTAMRSTWAPRTTRRRLTSLRWLARTQDDPLFLADYSPPKVVEDEPRPLDGGVDDVLAMIDYAVRDWEPALVALMGLCGLRVSEACAITVEEIDATQRELRVRGKGDKTRTVPVSNAAWAHISARALIVGSGRLVPVTPRHAARALDGLALDAGLEQRIHPHMLRVTFGTAMLHAGNDIVTVQRILGHDSVATTMRYLGTDRDRMRAAVEVA